ncbi:hypothetical protein GSI_12496 [Ganoderma sinense ZZ0214-1]|uniref:Uncharacterized protein n=1 Tax=Ganoderma sinense ZZ0214-1 TaxID=1077348 RepID=A0A2G8RSX5_9APHY|nr:hypothetical protein GSI_12496 [Ganoderma sinense ZZ0214-1]
MSGYTIPPSNKEVVVVFVHPWSFLGTRRFEPSAYPLVPLPIERLLACILNPQANFRYGVVGEIVMPLGYKNKIQTPPTITQITTPFYSPSRTYPDIPRDTQFSTSHLHDALGGKSFALCTAVHMNAAADNQPHQSDIPFFENASFVAFFNEPLTTNLVSRFLLHLQYVNHKTRSHASTSSLQTSIAFADSRVLGSLDQSLSDEDFFGGDDVDDEAE